MKYMNQNDYADIPYPSPSLLNATVKSGGCGVCTAANVLQFFGIDVSVKDMAKVFLDKKIRVNGGTDMHLAAKYLSDTYSLKYSTTSDENALIATLQAGAIATANVGGDRTGHMGILSNGGHYINIIGYDGDPPKPVIVFDVGYYAEKFTAAHRSPFVSVFTDKDGNVCLYTTAAALDADTKNRSPNYYIFTKEPKTEEDKSVTQKEFDAMMDNWIARKRALPPGNWKDDELNKAIAAGITDGVRPRDFATREEAAVMTLRAVSNINT